MPILTTRKLEIEIVNPRRNESTNLDLFKTPIKDKLSLN
jgi:hypothetical protein